MNAPLKLSPEALALTLLPAGVQRIAIENREQWMGLRGQDITASVAGALFQEHQYATRYGLYLEKAGLAPPQEEVTPTVTEDSIILPPILRGTLFEKTAIEMVRLLKPEWSVFAANNAYYRMAAARIGATPDVFATRPDVPGLGIIQVKTTDGLIFRKKWLNEDGEVEIPAWIAIQAIVEAKLTGASWACVALMIGGINTELKLFDIPIHDGVWARLIEEVEEFWRRVEERDPPEPDYARDGDLVRSTYAGDESVEADWSADNRVPAILDERAELKAVEKAGSEAEKKRKALEVELLAKLGNAAAGRAADGRVVRVKTIRVNRKPQPASTYSYPKFTIEGEAA
ncbi:endonuclease [Boseaceae bacterium BT-24-1]|nr:endonuclease [Boseaceae bacterium BT-24-1]